ncbi:hypothetical protein V1517DRAFT_285301 [Lipomyces orientalis]|uniref:Uncharacterized protein n=1 Tax=Lipomyces orientalis TaxID=1233043 RepID=A0ACC3TWG9_9ASCO
MGEKKEVVIIGGGIFGVNLIAKFRNAYRSTTANMHITLIEARDDFVYSPLNIRNCIEDVSDVFIKPYDRLFLKKPTLGRVICGLATGVDQDRKVVLLQSGEEVRYDILVLATGTSFEDPNNVPRSNHSDVLKYFAEKRELIEKSYSILIIGGGPTGAELAAEIADRYRSKKKVTLIHSEPLPLTEVYSEPLRQQVLTYLLQSRVTVHLKARGTDNGDGTVTMVKAERGGDNLTTEVLRADVVFHTMATKPVTEMYPETWKDDRGYIRVKDTLQLVDDDSIFAIGDLNDIREGKTAGKIHYSLPVVYSNILSLVNDKKPSKVYNPPAEYIALTMGKYRATGQITMPLIGPVVLPSWLLMSVLGKHINAENAIASLGY